MHRNCTAMYRTLNITFCHRFPIGDIERDPEYDSMKPTIWWPLINQFNAEHCGIVTTPHKTQQSFSRRWDSSADIIRNVYYRCLETSPSVSGPGRQSPAPGRHGQLIARTEKASVKWGNSSSQVCNRHACQLCTMPWCKWFALQLAFCITHVLKIALQSSAALLCLTNLYIGPGRLEWACV